MAIIQKDKARLALSRFGFGVSAKQSQSDLEAMARDPKGALLAELDAGITPMDAGLPNTAQAAARTFAFNKQVTAMREQTKQMNNSPDNVMAIDPKMVNEPKPAPVNEQMLNYQAELASFTKLAYEANLGFVERLMWFWNNHFAISIEKSGLVRSITGSYHRETVRKHGLGKLEDLLLAVERHPAMLLYLDNARSVGANSQFGLRSKTGLNENLAREILELHTMGVGSGYSQTDVTELAKIITGWTSRNQNDMEKQNLPFDFVFNPFRHEPNEKTLLSKKYGEGEMAGIAALKDLAHHEKTAGFIAQKIATHFISDNPSPALVKKLKDNFLKTKGDLKLLAKTLVEADESWSPELTKVRRPQEWMMAISRAGNFISEPQRFITISNILGQPFFRPNSPKGFSDEKSVWLPSLSTRVDVAHSYSRFIKNETGENSPLPFAEKILGREMSAMTRQTISRAESIQQGVVLTLMSPEFIRR